MNRFHTSGVAATLALCGVVTGAGIGAQQVTAAAQAPQSSAPQTTTVPVNRGARDTWTPIMEVLRPSRTAAVTDAQLQRLRELPVEAVWAALQGRQYVRTFEGPGRTVIPPSRRGPSERAERPPGPRSSSPMSSGVRRTRCLHRELQAGDDGDEKIPGARHLSAAQSRAGKAVRGMEEDAQKEGVKPNVGG